MEKNRTKDDQLQVIAGSTLLTLLIFSSPVLLDSFIIILALGCVNISASLAFSRSLNLENKVFYFFLQYISLIGYPCGSCLLLLNAFYNKVFNKTTLWPVLDLFYYIDENASLRSKFKEHDLKLTALDVFSVCLMICVSSTITFSAISQVYENLLGFAVCYQHINFQNIWIALRSASLLKLILPTGYYVGFVFALKQSNRYLNQHASFFHKEKGTLTDWQNINSFTNHFTPKGLAPLMAFGLVYRTTLIVFKDTNFLIEFETLTSINENNKTGEFSLSIKDTTYLDQNYVSFPANVRSLSASSLTSNPLTFPNLLFKASPHHIFLEANKFKLVTPDQIEYVATLDYIKSVYLLNHQNEVAFIMGASSAPHELFEVGHYLEISSIEQIPRDIGHWQYDLATNSLKWKKPIQVDNQFGFCLFRPENEVGDQNQALLEQNQGEKIEAFTGTSNKLGGFATSREAWLKTQESKLLLNQQDGATIESEQAAPTVNGELSLPTQKHKPVPNKEARILGTDHCTGKGPWTNLTAIMNSKSTFVLTQANPVFGPETQENPEHSLVLVLKRQVAFHDPETQELHIVQVQKTEIVSMPVIQAKTQSVQAKKFFEAFGGCSEQQIREAAQVPERALESSCSSSDFTLFEKLVSRLTFLEESRSNRTLDSTVKLQSYAKSLNSLLFKIDSSKIQAHLYQQEPLQVFMIKAVSWLRQRSGASSSAGASNPQAGRMTPNPRPATQLGPRQGGTILRDVSVEGTDLNSNLSLPEWKDLPVGIGEPVDASDVDRLRDFRDNTLYPEEKYSKEWKGGPGEAEMRMALDALRAHLNLDVISTYIEEVNALNDELGELLMEARAVLDASNTLEVSQIMQNMDYTPRLWQLTVRVMAQGVDPYLHVFKLNNMQLAMAKIAFAFDLFLELNRQKKPLQKKYNGVAEIERQSQTSSPDLEIGSTTDEVSSVVSGYSSSKTQIATVLERLKDHESLKGFSKSEILKQFHSMFTSIFWKEYDTYRREHGDLLHELSPSELLSRFEEVTSGVTVEDLEELVFKFTNFPNANVSIFEVPTFYGTLNSGPGTLESGTLNIVPLQIGTALAHHLSAAVEGGGARESVPKVYGNGSTNRGNLFALNDLDHGLATVIEPLVQRANLILTYTPRIMLQYRNLYNNIEWYLDESLSRNLRQTLRKVIIGYGITSLAIELEYQSSKLDIPVYTYEDFLTALVGSSRSNLRTDFLKKLLKPEECGFSNAENPERTLLEILTKLSGDSKSTNCLRLAKAWLTENELRFDELFKSFQRKASPSIIQLIAGPAEIDGLPAAKKIWSLLYNKAIASTRVIGSNMSKPFHQIYKAYRIPKDAELTFSQKTILVKPPEPTTAQASTKAQSASSENSVPDKDQTEITGQISTSESSAAERGTNEAGPSSINAPFAIDPDNVGDYVSYTYSQLSSKEKRKFHRRISNINQDGERLSEQISSTGFANVQPLELLICKTELEELVGLRPKPSGTIRPLDREEVRSEFNKLGNLLKEKRQGSSSNENP